MRRLVGIITTKKSFRIFILSYLHRRLNQRIKKFQTFYYISVATSIWVFLLELYEMKFSYKVLRGGAPLVYLSQ